MNRIKCFMVEKGELQVTKTEPRACDCADPNCCIRTPGACGVEGCGVTEHQVCKRVDTGEEVDPYETPGAMRFVDPKSYQCAGFDGKCLAVCTPAGIWLIDSEASNCTRKRDKTHRCWVRQGEAPNITVGKSGETCAAGAGSILINCGDRNYHGFLRGGYLEEC